jgi:hypothetical protein
MSFCQFLPVQQLKKSVVHDAIQTSLKTSSFLALLPDKAKEKSSAPTSKSWTTIHRQQLDSKDYNIFHIDSKIKEMLTENIGLVPNLIDDLYRSLNIFETDSDPVQKILAKEKISQLRKTIKDFESGFQLSYYIYQTHDLLEEYRKLFKQTNTKSFM